MMLNERHWQHTPYQEVRKVWNVFAPMLLFSEVKFSPLVEKSRF